MDLYYCNSKPSMKVIAVRWQPDILGNTNDLFFLTKSNLTFCFDTETYIEIYDEVRHETVALRKGDWLMWVDNCCTVCNDEFFHKHFVWCGDTASAINYYDIFMNKIHSSN